MILAHVEYQCDFVCIILRRGQSIKFRAKQSGDSLETLIETLLFLQCFELNPHGLISPRLTFRANSGYIDGKLFEISSTEGLNGLAQFLRLGP